MNDQKAAEFLKQLQRPGRFKLFLLAKLPLAYVAGLKLVDVSRQHCKVSLKLNYWTKNPFRSIYFAALSMAAEMSTGILGFMHVRSAERPVSMLMIHQSGDFTKKAVGKVEFECSNGAQVKKAIETAVSTNEPQTVDAYSVGQDEAGDEVARFTFRWSFKAKSN